MMCSSEQNKETCSCTCGCNGKDEFLEKLSEKYEPIKDNLIQMLNEVQVHYGYVPVHSQKFLSEFLRVLKPGGRIYLTIPIDFKRDKSFEVDNAETPEERFKYYGQKDHVRIYGKDIIAKLKDKYNAEFLDVEALKIQDINKQRICSDDSVFIITKS